MRKKNVYSKVVLGVILCCFIVSSVIINMRVNLPDFFIKDGVLFVDRVLTHPFTSFNNDDYDKLVVENENLKKEVDRAQSYIAENEELVSELNKLRELTGIDSLLSDKNYVNASVISRGLDYWNDYLIVDKGTSDNVSNDMAVVSGGSLVGITSSVSSYNSNVILLTNSKFPVNISVKIKIGDSYVYGILNNYSDGLFEVMGIVENIDIPKGSKVVTTGLGNLFPSGLLIGTVTDISTDNFDLSKIVRVKSSIDFNDISYVSIVKKGEK